MNITKYFLSTLISLALASTACAQNPASKSPQAAPQAQSTIAKKAKPDHDPLIAAIDKNKDGCMTKEEWQAVGMPMSSFNGLVKDGCVTKKIMMESEAPDNIDLNEDGILTLEEFLEFDKKMAPQMSGEGGAPQGGAPAQGAPAK